MIWIAFVIVVLVVVVSWGYYWWSGNQEIEDSTMVNRSVDTDQLAEKKDQTVEDKDKDSVEGSEERDRSEPVSAGDTEEELQDEERKVQDEEREEADQGPEERAGTESEERLPDGESEEQRTTGESESEPDSEWLEEEEEDITYGPEDVERELEARALPAKLEPRELTVQPGEVVSVTVTPAEGADGILEIGTSRVNNNTYDLSSGEGEWIFKAPVETGGYGIFYSVEDSADLTEDDILGFLTVEK